MLIKLKFDILDKKKFAVETVVNFPMKIQCFQRAGEWGKISRKTQIEELHILSDPSPYFPTLSILTPSRTALSPSISVTCGTCKH